MMHRFARIRTPWFKNLQIRWYIRHFGVDMSIAAEANPRSYPDFNAFFTRALRPGVRPLPQQPDAVSTPVDGRVSQIGAITGERIVQAKGHGYDLTALLGGSADRARPFLDGQFATLYLSPRDYHRVHMPVEGRLREMVYVPGRLFSVNACTTRVIPGLFARNERVICVFDTHVGPMVVVLVGAIHVGGIETVWAGPVTPPYRLRPVIWQYGTEGVELDRGEELGRFNVGSTVVVLFPPGSVHWSSEIAAQSQVRMGQALGRLAGQTETGPPGPASY